MTDLSDDLVYLPGHSVVSQGPSVSNRVAHCELSGSFDSLASSSCSGSDDSTSTKKTVDLL